MAERYRNFATVLYEESAPKDFREIIVNWHVPCLLSPYHDSDVNPTGEPKKPHWHLMIMFEGKKSTDQVKKLFEEVNGVGCEVINSIQGYARYLCHLDNPEKHQYDTNDIMQFSSADYATICMLDTDRVKIMAEMQAWCTENFVLSFAELCTYAEIYHYDWYRLLMTSCTIPMMAFLKSMQWEIDKEYRRKDKYTERGQEVNGIND